MNEQLNSILNVIKTKFDLVDKKLVLNSLSLDYCPSDVLSMMYKLNDVDYTSVISKNKNTDQDILNELYNKDEYKFNIIENLNCPREILNNLLTTNDSVIYSHMMKNKTCPKKLFRMISDIDLSNPVCPKDVLLKYSYNADTLNIKEISSLASNKSMTNELLTIVFNSKLGYTARYSFATNINCPEEILTKIYEKNNNKDLLLLILKNPNCPYEIIKHESISEDIEIQRSIALNPSVPQEILNKLSLIEDEELMCNLASNKRYEDLVNLSNNPSVKVRKCVLENDSTNIEIINSMIKDINEEIAICALFKIYNYYKMKNEIIEITDSNPIEEESRKERKEENTSYDEEFEKIQIKEEKEKEERRKQTLKEIKDLQNVLIHVNNPDENFTIRRLHHTIEIDEETLFDVNPNGSKEIKREYKDIIKYFDLSKISCKNMIASNIDFRNTNLDIDPQKVYDKDLSYSRFSDNNIHKFRNFDGVNMIGCDISETRLSVGKQEKEKAQILEDAINNNGGEVK